MRYQVQGTITRNRNGWDSTRQIPTFYLDGRVQGIRNVEHARDVARDIVDTIAGPGTPGETVTTALHVEPVKEPAEAGLSPELDLASEASARFRARRDAVARLTRPIARPANPASWPL